MISLYAATSLVRFILLLFLYLGVCAQIGNVILLYSLEAHRKNLWRILFETGISVHYLVLMLSTALIQTASESMLVVDPYPSLRFLTMLVPLLGVPVLMFEHKNSDLVAIVCTMAVLPFMEQVFQQQFYNVLVYSTAILLLRSLTQLALVKKSIDTGFSHISMKEAFDYFPEGLAIGQPKGQIFLINQPMRDILDECNISADGSLQDLSAQLLGIAVRNPLISVEGMSKNAERKLSKLLSFEACGKIFRLARAEVHTPDRVSEQISALNITEESQLLTELNQKNKELRESNAQLEGMLRNINEIETERESNKMRNRIHDVMGQRLSILHMYLQQMDNNNLPPLNELIPLLEDMLKDLRDGEQQEPLMDLGNIVSAIELIGTRMTIEGQLPDDFEVNQCLLAILREASTNAIRHGQAKNIQVRFSATPKAYRMSIDNDGSVPRQKVSEGDGIRGMRFKAEELGGQLEIQCDEHFRVIVRIPTEAEKENEIATRGNTDTELDPQKQKEAQVGSKQSKICEKD